MGLFDRIHFEGKVYQTKDFDCTMHYFYIEGGRLLTSVGHTEDRSDATRWKNEHPGEPLPPELEGLLGMCGCITWVEDGRKDLNFHGIVNFYGPDEPDSPWNEFNAKFTDGALIEVRQIDDNDRADRRGASASGE